ncbi:hypothetical protein H2200_004306 [Cladophialophora chaetospira]|uniref:BTB domain transcription factor n=1 Tax=Cladophialophora chaetospira TaxID=386627 RepID=A0AA38XCW4_9EURO|nr:hypothetical protein H2200_004306 [Cladophialophora chaetospira]
MTGRRSSARLAALSSSQGSQNSSPPPIKSSPSTKKRKSEAAGSSPNAKRGKKDAEPEQKTLEETMNNGTSEQPGPEKPDEEMKDADEDKQEKAQTDQASGEDKEEAPQAEHAESQEDKKEAPRVEQANGKEEDKQEAPQATRTNGDVSEHKQKQESPKEENTDEKKEGENKEAKAETSEPKQETKTTETNGNAVEAGARNDDDVASTILEKGVIYFFFRPRVSVDDPQDVTDVARSFLVLRPIPLDAKLGDGPIGDENNCRLIALPKKVLPKSGKDRFVTFVEKCKTSFAELKETFLTGSEYETQTLGTRHTAPVTPLAEGIYAITSTGRESHLAYIINIPSELGEVQADFGLKQRGSFVASVKNPDQPPTAGAQQNVPPGPKYPQEIIDEFRGLRWKPLEPKYLDYDQASFLIIGEDYAKATEQRPKDERENNAPPEQEMEKLEGEDEIRVKHLKGEYLRKNYFSDFMLTTPQATMLSSQIFTLPLRTFLKCVRLGRYLILRTRQSGRWLSCTYKVLGLMFAE